MRLSIDSLSCGYGRKDILQGVSLSLESGQVLCLLGANGSGKTTLLKTVVGLIMPRLGAILMDGEDIMHWTPKQRASCLGYVPQEHTPPFAYTVRDVVLMARAVHLKLFSAPEKRDLLIAEKALDQLQIRHLAEQLYTEISGGERQLVLIARALAQEPHFLILDEPTANLDFGNQIRVLRTIQFLRSTGIAMFMTTHSPDHAFLCGTHVALMKNGRILAAGDPQEVLTESLLTEAYGVSLKVLHLTSHPPMVVPALSEKELA